MCYSLGFTGGSLATCPHPNLGGAGYPSCPITDIPSPPIHAPLISLLRSFRFFSLSICFSLGCQC
jgi:hypothetical protein